METMINKGEAMQNPNPKSTTLADLVRLRYTDYDAFMSRLFEALNGDHRDAINDSTDKSQKIAALSTMLSYFEGKEEFEKCIEIKKLIDQL